VLSISSFLLISNPPFFLSLSLLAEIPILPTITAKITFQEFAFRDDLPEELFSIPEGYEEKPNRFPDL
jgi:hypothetical protein